MSDRVLVGRTRERAELLSGLQEAASGRGGVHLLAGEPGIGKTSLAAWFAREAERRGARAVWGRAWEAGGAPAYWPWRQALRALSLELPPGGEAGDDAVQARFTHFERVVGLLASASADRPLVLVLDDLHAADTSSLLLLDFVATEIRSLPVLVLGTFREHAARLAPEAAGHLARVVRDATYLPLRRLDRDEAAELVRVGGAGLDAAGLAELYRVTEGNPLFLREVLRLLPAGGSASPRAFPLPEGVREVLQERLSRLDPSARAALDLAAVAGREFTAAVVAGVMGAREDEVERALAPAARAEVVVELGAGSWAFTHVLLRDALYRALAPDRRAALHGAVAAALERVRGPAVSPAELAHHRLLAVPAIPAEAAVDAALRAADRAEAELAFEDAATLLERALPLAPEGPRRIEALIALSLARTRAGEPGAGKRAAREAAALAAAAGEGERLARAALAHGAEFTPAMIDPELVELLEHALARLPPEDGALRARVMARLAAARQPAQDPEAPIALAREAIAMVRRAGDEADHREVLHAAISALADVAHPRERAALGEELLRRSEAAGDRLRTLRTHARLVFDHAEAGDLPRARAHLETFAALAAGFRAPRYRWPPLLMRAMWAGFEGRDDDFTRLQAEARAAGDPAADRNLRFALAVQRAEWRLLRDGPEALGDLEADLREAGATAALRDLVIPAYVARIAARRGDLARARAALAAIPADLYAAGQFQALVLTEPVVAVGDLDRAARLHARLLPMADRLPSFGMSGMVLGPPMSRYLGLLAAALSRRAEAAAHFRDAITRLEALGGAVWLERVRGEADALGAARAPAPPLLRPPPLELVREGEYFTIRSGASATRLRDSKGLRMLAQLVAHPGEELHALALAAPGSDGVALGDAGEVLDRAAARAYRARLEDARDALLEAERLGDVGRAARAQGELEWLAGELARGVGLGGRQRRAGSAAERARVNVQRRIRQAIERIGRAQPELGRFLAWAVKTGTYCSYQPDGTSFRARSRSSP